MSQRLLKAADPEAETQLLQRACDEIPGAEMAMFAAFGVRFSVSRILEVERKEDDVTAVIILECSRGKKRVCTVIQAQWVEPLPVM